MAFGLDAKLDPMMAARNGSAMGTAGTAIAGANAAGLYNPAGNGLGFRLRRRGALRNADNMRRRELIAARLAGLDPAQARVARIGADTAASGSVADALNAGQESEYGANRDWARGLLGNQLGYENQRNLLKYQSDLQRPTLGGQIGGLVGQGAAAYLTGGTSLLAGGGDGMDSPPWVMNPYAVRR